MGRLDLPDKRRDEDDEGFDEGGRMERIDSHDEADVNRRNSRFGIGRVAGTQEALERIALSLERLECKFATEYAEHCPVHGRTHAGDDELNPWAA